MARSEKYLMKSVLDAYRSACLPAVFVCFTGCNPAAWPSWMNPVGGRDGASPTGELNNASDSIEPPKKITILVPPNLLPIWVKSPPDDSQFVYFVGDAGGGDKEDVLERAWYSALVRIGMTEFPELTKLRSRSRETLEKASYERNVVINLQYIRWTGIAEAKDKGSPFIYRDPKTKGLAVYRLLKWAKQDVRTAHNAIKQKLDTDDAKTEKFAIPDSPEVAEEQESDAIEAVRKIKALGRGIASRDAELKLVIDNVKCGMTIRQLTEILGKPNGVSSQHSWEQPNFYWGTYQVSIDQAGMGVIKGIKTDLGDGKYRPVCAH